MKTQLDFGFPERPAPGLAWIRCRAHYGHADYQMTNAGKPTGWWVEWCGHPTALRPYTVRKPNGSNLDIYDNGSGPGFTTFRTSAEAKAEAERRAA